MRTLIYGFPTTGKTVFGDALTGSIDTDEVVSEYKGADKVSMLVHLFDPYTNPEGTTLLTNLIGYADRFEDWDKVYYFYRSDAKLVYDIMNRRSNPVGRNDVNISVIERWIDDAERTFDRLQVQAIDLAEDRYISHSFN